MPRAPAAQGTAVVGDEVAAIHAQRDAVNLGFGVLLAPLASGVEVAE